jgi:hypothetical protein
MYTIQLELLPDVATEAAVSLQGKAVTLTQVKLASSLASAASGYQSQKNPGSQKQPMVLKLVLGMLQLLEGHAVHVTDPSSDQKPATSAASHTVALVCVFWLLLCDGFVQCHL